MDYLSIRHKDEWRVCERIVKQDMPHLEKTFEHTALGKEPGPGKSGHILFMF